MFLKKFDIISPKISIYHKGSLIHSSAISGIISILSVAFIFNILLYYSLDMILKKIPKYIISIAILKMFLLLKSILHHFSIL